MSETAQPRVIKKYPNRRLYDTEKSQYVTLQQIRSLVLEEIPFIVIEQKSEVDITRAPFLGEHNDEVLASDLGLSPDEIAALQIDGALG